MLKDYFIINDYYLLLNWDNFHVYYTGIIAVHLYHYSVALCPAKAPEINFTQELKKKYTVKKKKEATMECFISDSRAKVRWLKNGEPIEVQ